MLSKMVKEIYGDYKIKFHPEGLDSDKTIEIDFTPPFRRVSMIEGLETKLNIEFPKNFSS
jgi:lysyl-tRNA synthetase class 2